MARGASDGRQQWRVVAAEGEPKNFIAHMALEGGGVVGFLAALIANVTGALDYRYVVVSRVDGRRLVVRSRHRFDIGDTILPSDWQGEEAAEVDAHRK